MCTFPTMKLLEGRRGACLLMSADSETAWAIIQAIDDARKKHTEETGCDCWQRAMQTDPWKFRLAMRSMPAVEPQTNQAHRSSTLDQFNGYQGTIRWHHSFQ